jgi:hypothetical protein
MRWGTKSLSSGGTISCEGFVIGISLPLSASEKCGPIITFLPCFARWRLTSKRPFRRVYVPTVSFNKAIKVSRSLTTHSKLRILDILSSFPSVRHNKYSTDMSSTPSNLQVHAQIARGRQLPRLPAVEGRQTCPS